MIRMPVRSLPPTISVLRAVLSNSMGVVLLAIFAWLGSPLAHANDTISTDARALHVLNRLGFGPRPGDIRRVEAMGIERYIDQQLHPESIPMPDSLKRRLQGYDTLKLDPVQLYLAYGPPRAQPGHRPDPQALKQARQRSRIILEQAQDARLLRAIESPRQLQEVLVDFWYNHFNVFAGKGMDHLWVGAYEQEAIRPYVLGHFRDLLDATARHPAMLFYLDNWLNTAPGLPGAHGRFDGINENYAREVMELHTLGVNGGYTQNDVISLAHILTGWGMRPGNRNADGQFGFYFDPRRHDFGDQIFLGHDIRGANEVEGEHALDMLARSPRTARHISYELAQYFVADHPDPALVNTLTQRFLNTDGDIREVLKTLFHSSQFWAKTNVNNKFKTPYQYVVSSVRATGMPVTNFRPLVGMLYQLGMPLYGCQTPNGYKNTQRAWLNPDAMNRRLGFATALASGRLPIDRPPPAANMVADAADGMVPHTAPMRRKPIQPADDWQLGQTLANQFSDRTLTALNSAPPVLRAALILGSPEFMRR